jgi:hypothetical protein
MENSITSFSADSKSNTNWSKVGLAGCAVIGLGYTGYRLWRNSQQTDKLSPEEIRTTLNHLITKVNGGSVKLNALESKLGELDKATDTAIDVIEGELAKMTERIDALYAAK